jgi:hypothetical protein
MYNFIEVDNTMKLTKYLSFLISIVVLSAWTYQLNRPSIFRGGTATNMSEEFATYGLNDTVMMIVGAFKISLALLLLIGGIKFSKLIRPAAAGMALFMIGAVYFHISIGDGVVPTLPSALMLLSCLILVFYPSLLWAKKS